jgi:5-methylcytosine-specific restriction endonuclease McrA
MVCRWPSSAIYRNLFDAVVQRDGFICRWCGIKTRQVPSGCSKLDPDHATLDHLIPRSRGGTNDLDNLLMACCQCNSRRPVTSGTPGLLTERELEELMRNG